MSRGRLRGRGTRLALPAAGPRPDEPDPADGADPADGEATTPGAARPPDEAPPAASDATSPRRARARALRWWPTRGRHAPRRRRGPRLPHGQARPWLWRAAAAWGLTSLALTVPLLLVLGPAPEFFVAHDSGPAVVLAFAVVVGVLAPLLVAVLSAAADLLGPVGRAVVLAPVALGAVAALLQPVGLLWLWVPLCLVGALALLWAEPREPIVRFALAAAGVVGLLVVAWFVGPSRTGAYLRDADDPELASEVARAGPDTPVVVLTFDELPLGALLASDLSINELRYPAFARLAAQSHWFRHASSVSGQTAYSVPAIWSGTRPAVGELPTASRHPTNLFVQLGARYRGHALEPITALCPGEVCADDGADAGGDEATGASPAPARTPDLVDDALVVLGHTVGGPLLRDRLPSISEGWAGFGAQDWAVEAGGDEVLDGAIGAYAQQVASAGAWAEGCTPSADAPLLCVAHVILPHGQWLANIDGSTYPPPVGGTPGAEVRGSGLDWTGSEAQRAAGYQRMLFQLAATDRLLGQLIDQLEANGVWDDAVVVVTADHGITFEPGYLRDGEQVETTAVPLFIKQPGQAEAVEHDDAALTIDAVPTVLGQLGLEVPDAVDGVDLLGEGAVPDERPDAMSLGGDRWTTPDQSEEALAEVVARRSSWVDPDGTWAFGYAVGDAGFVGTGTGDHPADDEPAGTWTTAEGTPSPSGNLATIELAPDEELARVVAVQGEVIVGSALAPEPGGSTALTFAVSPTVTDDLRTLDLYGVDADGVLRPLTPLDEG